jgi:hypothetical protein
MTWKEQILEQTKNEPLSEVFKKRDMKKKLIEMPEAIFKALEQSAKQNDRSVNKEINNLLKKALKVK